MMRLLMVMGLVVVGGVQLFAGERALLRQRALQDAAAAVAADVNASMFDGKTIAIRPFEGDTDGMFLGLLKNALKDFRLVEGKDDPMWDEILANAAWNMRKDDILDPTTVPEFGKFQAAQVLLHGSLTVVELKGESRATVSLVLHATDVATSRHLWGDLFMGRSAVAQRTTGDVDLDLASHDVVNRLFAKAQQSLIAKVQGEHSIYVEPLASDVVLTGDLVAMLSNVPGMTIQRKRILANEIVYGVVRELTRVADPAKDTPTATAFRVVADIQLYLEDIKTGTLVWTESLCEEETVYVDKPLTEAERAKLQTVSFVKQHLKTILWSVGGLLAVLALWITVKLIRSAHTVR